MSEDLRWPGLPPSFRPHFALVGKRPDAPQQLIHAPLASQLLNYLDGGTAQRGQGRRC